MYGTYEMLNRIVDKDDLKLELEDLVLLYQDELEPQYLAAAYNVAFPITLNVSNQKANWMITTEEKESLTLEVLNRCLQKYVVGSDAKFSTYYSKALKFEYNKLRDAYMTDKRNANVYSLSLERLEEETGYQVAVTQAEEDFEIEMYELAGLTSSEVMTCQYLKFGFNCGEIANIMGVSNATITNLKNKAKQKLLEVM